MVCLNRAGSQPPFSPLSIRLPVCDSVFFPIRFRGALFSGFSPLFSSALTARLMGLRVSFSLSFYFFLDFLNLEKSCRGVLAAYPLLPLSLFQPVSCLHEDSPGALPFQGGGRGAAAGCRASHLCRVDSSFLVIFPVSSWEPLEAPLRPGGRRQGLIADPPTRYHGAHSLPCP